MLSCHHGHQPLGHAWKSAGSAQANKHPGQMPTIDDTMNPWEDGFIPATPPPCPRLRALRVPRRVIFRLFVHPFFLLVPLTLTKMLVLLAARQYDDTDMIA